MSFMTCLYMVVLTGSLIIEAFDAHIHPFFTRKFLLYQVSLPMIEVAWQEQNKKIQYRHSFNKYAGTLWNQFRCLEVKFSLRWQMVLHWSQFFIASRQKNSRSQLIHSHPNLCRLHSPFTALSTHSTFPSLSPLTLVSVLDLALHIFWLRLATASYC